MLHRKSASRLSVFIIMEHIASFLSTFTFHSLQRQANIVCHLKMKVDLRKTPNKETKFFPDIKEKRKTAPHFDDADFRHQIKHSKMNLHGISFFKRIFGISMSLFLVEVSKWLITMLIMNVSDNSDDLLLPCMSSLSWRILVC